MVEESFTPGPDPVRDLQSLNLSFVSMSFLSSLLVAVMLRRRRRGSRPPPTTVADPAFSRPLRPRLLGKPVSAASRFVWSMQEKELQENVTTLLVNLPYSIILLQFTCMFYIIFLILQGKHLHCRTISDGKSVL